MRPRLGIPAFIAIVCIAVLAGNRSGHTRDLVSRENPFALRSFLPVDGDRWIGNAICYGPHRDGQRPGDAAPSASELREDLRLMLPHWNLLRIYNSSEFAETLLSVIREDSLSMKVMLGVWIAPEEKRDENGAVLEKFPEAAAANRQEVDDAVRLATAYPDIVAAVSVGNETQIFWSAH